jgi:hypothetical protein
LIEEAFDLAALKETVAVRTINASGFRIRLLPIAVLRLLNEPPPGSGYGVYFLWSATDELLYVGQSRSVSMRVSDHRSNLRHYQGGRPEMVHGRSVFVFARATWLPIEWPMHLALGAAYIEHFKPRGNGRGS